MTPFKVKAETLEVGDVFLSRSSKMTVARIKSRDNGVMNLFVLSHLMSSYHSIKINYGEMVELVEWNPARIL